MGTKLEICPVYQVFQGKFFQIDPSILEFRHLHIPDLSQPSSNLKNLWKIGKYLFFDDFQAVSSTLYFSLPLFLGYF